MVARLLPDGRRLHLQDGPIDLIIGADGVQDAVAAAYRAAAGRFAGLLDELCADLALLRAPAVPDRPPAGIVARRMWAAVLPHAARAFITPMAAVAGAVAEEILAAMCAAAPLDRAYVNNGGDIALHLAPGMSLAAGLVDRPDRPSLVGSATIRAADPVRGIATSGWRGRSFSLGIADAVTVLVGTAAEADAAATVVANAVDLPGHGAIARRRARDLQPDSDLGDRLVTVAVGPLDAAEIERALAGGLREADRLIGEGRIVGAALQLATRVRVAGDFRDLTVPGDRHATVTAIPGIDKMLSGHAVWAGRRPSGQNPTFASRKCQIELTTSSKS
ncbi:UPF0280 family protein [Prosthecomicrobium hirschii]|uniref:UPF0280 family protein n=1 Tax=Prosthecodimorpha hirschii TaxID=665126 RepID=UPI0009F90F07|nr:UPF0280 family protein [Prosthecomicrobium hirschii]